MKIQIAARQLSWLTAILIMMMGVISFPKEIVQISGIHTLYVLTIPLLFAVGLCYFFHLLSVKFPGKNLFEISEALCGKFGGLLINLLFMTHFWMILLRDSKAVNYLVNATLLIKTPEEVLMLLYFLVLIYFAKNGLEVTVRVNDLLVPLFLFFLWLLPLFLIRPINLGLIMPVFAGDTINWFKGSLLHTGWYGDLLVVGAFLHALPKPQQVLPALRHGIFIGFFSLQLLILLDMTVLGIDVTGRLLFPNYTLVEQIQLSDFIDRLEIFLFSVSFPVYVSKSIIVMLAILQLFRHYFPSKQHNLFRSNLPLFVMMLALFSFDNITQLLDYSEYGQLFLVIAWLPLLLLLGILAFFRPTPDSKTSGDSQQSANSNTNTSSAWLQLPWSLITNAIIFIIVASLCIGFVLHNRPWAANTAFILYMSGFFFIVITSYMEKKQQSSIQ